MIEESGSAAPRREAVMSEVAVRLRFGLRKVEIGRGSIMPWLVGSLLAAGAAYALTVPLWKDRAEGLAADFLFRYGRLNPPRADGRIIHVDINDSSLDSFGRWPWRRSLVAKAINAIDACGPSVIALDLLFDEPDFDRPGDDEALVDAIAGANAQVVVAIKFPTEVEQLSRQWLDADGPAALRRVIDGLKADITLDATTLIERAELDESRGRRVRDRLQSFRELAIEEAARAVGDPSQLSLELMLEHLIPENKRGFRFRGIELVVGKVVDGVLIERHLATRLAGVSRSGVMRRMNRLEAPLINVAKAADATGFVTTETDRDGAIRRVAPAVAYGGRIHPQLGVAAAMAHLRHRPDEIEVLNDGVRIGQTILPLSEGASLVVWPRIEDGPGPLNLLTARAWGEVHNPALGLLRRNPDDSANYGHITLGHVLDLHLRIEELGAKKDRYDELSREIIRTFLASAGYSPDDWDDPRRRAELVAEIESEAQFRLPSNADGEPVDPGRDASDEEKSFWDWRLRHVSLPAEERDLLAAKQRLVESIRGKIVFVGWVTTGSLSDVYPTAAGPLTPGVVVNAMMANMVLTGLTYREAPIWIGAMLTFALGSFAAFVAGMRAIRPLLGLLLACVIALGYLIVNAFILFDSSQLFVPLATPLASIGLGLFGSTFARSLYERSERSRLTRQFGNRIHRRLFDYLLEHPDVIDMSGSQREVTCLFGDLAGFTSVSESMDSRSTVALLNRYMGSMNALLTEHSAYVNKFLGDGLMAFWGAFEEDSAHADRAVRAAIACVLRIEELNLDAGRNGQPRLTMRFGLSSGPVTVGDCGAPPEFSDFTVIGDSVNLAARLESANKQFGTSILINARTNEMLGPDVRRRPVGLVTVVGQSRPVELFEVLPVEPGTDDEEILALMEGTAEAVRLYRDRRLDEAQAAWEGMVAQHGQSRLAALYLAEIARYKANADDLFDGVIRLSTK